MFDGFMVFLRFAWPCVAGYGVICRAFLHNCRCGAAQRWRCAAWSTVVPDSNSPTTTVMIGAKPGRDHSAHWVSLRQTGSWDRGKRASTSAPSSRNRGSGSRGHRSPHRPGFLVQPHPRFDTQSMGMHPGCRPPPQIQSADGLVVRVLGEDGAAVAPLSLPDAGDCTFDPDGCSPGA